MLKRPSHKRSGRVGPLIWELLDVGVARVVIDAGVQIDVAGTAVAVAPALGPLALRPGCSKRARRVDIDVQERSGARALIAVVGLPSRSAALGEPVAVQDLPDCRAAPSADPRQPARTEIGLPARSQDWLLLGG